LENKREVKSRKKRAKKSNYMQAASFGVAAHSTVDTPCGSRKLDEEKGQR
jgi:hypothetical protein